MSKFLYTLREDKLQECLGYVKDSIVGARRAMSCEDYIYTLNQAPKILDALPHLSEILFSFSKFKVEDRVMIKEIPNIEKGSGLYPGKHYIVPRNPAVIKSVNLEVKEEGDKIEFCFDYLISFENASWISFYNKDSFLPEITFNPLKGKGNPQYYFREDKLTEVVQSEDDALFIFELTEGSKKYNIVTEITKSGDFYVDAHEL